MFAQSRGGITPARLEDSIVQSGSRLIGRGLQRPEEADLTRCEACKLLHEECADDVP